MLPILLAAMLAPDTPRNMTVEELGEGRYRLTIVYAGGSPMDHARMQDRMKEHAQQLCGGRSVSVGALDVADAPRRRIALSGTYTCRAN
jgi:hypothetical protein